MKDKIRRLRECIQFGKITEHVKAIDGGVASEIEYRDRKGRPIGYWAYGSFDPAGAYPLKPINTYLLNTVVAYSILSLGFLYSGNPGASVGWLMASYAVYRLRQLHIKILHLEGRMP